MMESQLNPVNVDVVLTTLHRKKSAVYGNAWRKRGELLSIFPNIARKYDRLENAAAWGELAQFAGAEVSVKVEPLLDTVADLAIYALKYLTFLAEQQRDAFPNDLDASLYADFDDALKQTREASPHLTYSAPLANDLSKTFARISREMARIERILVQPDTGAVLGEKIRAAFALAASSLVLLDQLISCQPMGWAAFVAEVDEL